MQLAPVNDHCHNAADVMAACRRSMSFRLSLEERERARIATQRQREREAELARINAENAALAAREAAENRIREEYAKAIPKITALRVIQLGCKILGVSYQDICSDRRMRPLPDHRHCLAWCARELTPRSLISIGGAMGDRDHTTILNGIRRVEVDISAGGELGRKAQALKAAIIALIDEEKS